MEEEKVWAIASGCHVLLGEGREWAEWAGPGFRIGSLPAAPEQTRGLTITPSTPLSPTISQADLERPSLNCPFHEMPAAKPYPGPLALSGSGLLSSLQASEYSLPHSHLQGLAREAGTQDPHHVVNHVVHHPKHAHEAA